MSSHRTIVAVIFAALFLPLGVRARMPAAAGPVVVLGNSIAEGFIEGAVDTVARYSSRLAADLDRDGTGAEVVNAGHGGDTSRDGFLRLDDDVLRLAPRVVTVSFGPNDYRIDDPSGVQVNAADYALYLRAILDRIAASGARPVLLSLVPVDAGRYYTTHDRALYEPFGGIGALWETYDREVREAAAETGTPIVDLAVAFGDSGGVLLGSDGGHPNARGHRTIENALLPFVTAALEAEGGGQEGGGSTGTGGAIRSLSLYPNPFRPAAAGLLRIAYETGTAGDVTAEVYGLSGQRVATPVRGLFRVAGRAVEFWDGADDRGRPLPAGLYLVRLAVRPAGPGPVGRRTAKLAILR